MSASQAEGVPDPFQLEDSDDVTTEEDDEEEEDSEHLNVSDSRPRSAVHSGLQSPAAQDVPLGSPIPPSQVAQAAAAARKIAESKTQSLPAPPPAAEVPALFLPGLISPSLFLPIPNTDQLSVFLNRYIAPDVRPVRDLSGAWENSDVHSLVMTNSWRALARMARDQLVKASPDDLSLIFELWYLRLSSLARLRLFNQAAAECTNFFGVLAAVQPEMVRTYIFDSLLPFELEVVYARTKYWANDTYGYLDELYALVVKCKHQSRASTDEADVEMWKERAVRMGLIIASQFLEMKDHIAAANILLPLCKGPQPPSPALLSSIARIYLDAGDVESATKIIDQIEANETCDDTTKEINRALLASARMDWPVAVENLQSAINREPENALVANNLAVALLSVGKVDEGIRYMEQALVASPSIVGNVEPFLFNLSTLYELRTAASFDKKCNLLIEAGKWAGDGLRANCLKLPPV